MAALPYIQLYVADYLADTAHLTAAQHGAYLLLIFNYWQRGKPLNNFNERLTNVARMSSDEWEKNKNVLQEFFIINGDEWSHSRIEADLAAVLAKSTKASNAGKASAKGKLNRRLTNVEQTLNHTDTDTDTDTDKNKEVKKRSQKKVNTEKTLSEFLEDCKTSGEKAIREDDPIFEWAKTIGLPEDMLYLGWTEFKNLQAADKKQADWRATFRIYVKRDYLHLWAINKDGEYYLTLRGKQLERELNGAPA